MSEPDLAVRIEPVHDRIAAVGSLLAETFAATPSPAMARVPYPRRVRILRGILTDATRDLAQHGHVLVALDTNGSSERVLGALLPSPPCPQPRPTATQRPPTSGSDARPAPSR